MSGYSKLARNTAARKALLRDLITDLILNGSIQTTVTKAKELKRLLICLIFRTPQHSVHSSKSKWECRL